MAFAAPTTGAETHAFLREVAMHASHGYFDGMTDEEIRNELLTHQMHRKYMAFGWDGSVADHIIRIAHERNELYNEDAMRRKKDELIALAKQKHRARQIKAFARRGLINKMMARQMEES